MLHSSPIRALVPSWFVDIHFQTWDWCDTVHILLANGCALFDIPASCESMRPLHTHVKPQSVWKQIITHLKS
jgi:hypothetical protein